MKQHAPPVIIKGDKVESLVEERLESTSYSEDWIQDLCFNYPSLLPVTELEPTFGEMIPICRELPVESGYADLLYINEYGFITIGECKLWRNPEARRKVVGQILDYAKDMAKWDYSKFESACLKAGKRNEKSLFEIIQNYYPDIEEVDFIDNVQKNLKKGRFLLLIIGDGIQENMEDLVKYIHRNENLHFTLGLIELPIYKNQANEIIITPRILAKTKEIERIIYRNSDKSIEENNQQEQMIERSQTISEKGFYELLAKSIGAEKTDEFEQLIAKVSSLLNIKPSVGGSTSRSINLKSLNGYNFITIFQGGSIYFYRATWKAEESIHLNYMNEIARMVGGQLENDKLTFRIKKIDGHDFNIADLLEMKDRWIEILTETIDAVYQLEKLFWILPVICQ